LKKKKELTEKMKVQGKTGKNETEEKVKRVGVAKKATVKRHWGRAIGD
jgi:hypothetical protein